MTDIKVLSIRDVLPITAVEYAAISPQSLLISGHNLDQTTQILINELISPEFIVESANRVVAQVPISERGSLLYSVNAIANKPSMSRRSLLHFELLAMRGISGIEKLVQIFCRLLLQTPGSDRFHPEEGGGLLKIVGTSVSRSDHKMIQAAAISSVSRTQDQILARQAIKFHLPANERLLSAVTESVNFDASTTTLSCRVAVTAVSGRLAVANMML